MSFVHLHNHTDFSILDGACKVDDLCLTAKKMNMPAVAITDHGNLCGAIDFYSTAVKNKIKPIIGSELYLTNGSRIDRGKDLYGKNSPIYHLLLLAKNRTGWENLMKLSSAGYLEGFYRKPRVDYELLEKHHEGLICLSGCIQSHISQSILKKGDDEGYKLAKRYKDLFGDDFYLELQQHGLEEEDTVVRALLEFSKKLGAKTVATNDTHYLTRDHAVPHDLLLCVQTKSDYDDPGRWRFTGEEFYLKSREEMLKLFGEIPEALDNTLEIAEKVNLELDFNQKHFPEFPLPENVESDDAYLEELCREGLPKRYSEVTPQVLDRLKLEMEVISSKKLASYFLIVRDFIVYAREKGIPVGPGRGSAAGSLVSYLVGITDIDPLKYDLLFERFINPERESYPDIDVDFSDDRRAEVIEYVKRRYGEECVTQIITFGRMLSRGVLRDVGRVMKVPLPEVDAIAKMIPDNSKSTLKEIYKENKELSELIKSKKEYIELFERAVQLEGTIRNTGIHAAGVVITPRPLNELVPLYKSKDKGISTQFDMGNVEKIGLLKVDFLGLKTLTIIEKTLELISKNHPPVNLEEIPLDDPKTYELFSNGLTAGVFQFESGGMRENLIKLKPERLEDLIAMNALYRPGPMDHVDDFIDRKHGRKEIQYLHPSLADILDETYGVIVYQEQVMKIANVLGGMSLGRADILRRAMGKKKSKLMETMHPEFLEGCLKNGIPKKIAEKIWFLIHEFAKYGFNKSHAAGYAYLAYQTAYLKAHYPSEFLAASMTVRKDDTDQLVHLLNECKKLGIEVLPPDVNESDENFSVTKEGDVRFGLSAIKNVGSAAIQAITGARTVNGNFSDLFDLVSCTDNPLVNHKVIENLILAGATGSLAGNRAEQLNVLDSALAYAQQIKQEKTMRQVNIFGGEDGIALPRPEIPTKDELPPHEILSSEKNLLGIYFSGHPLLDVQKESIALSTASVQDLKELNHDARVQIVGLFSQLDKRQSRNGNLMARGLFEDLTGAVKAIVFPKTYEEIKEKLDGERACLLSGRVQIKENAIEIFVEDVEPLEQAVSNRVKEITLEIQYDVSERTMLKLEQELRRFPGQKGVRFILVDRENSRYVMKSSKYHVKPCHELFDCIEEILGEGAVVLMTRH